MKRVLLSLLVLAVAVTAARAHFVWILPPAGDAKPVVQVVFSDKLEPDDPKFLEKIKQTELFVFDKDGKATPVKLTQGKQAWEAEVPGTGPRVVGAVCRYGVVQRGDAEPYMLHYSAKSLLLPAGEDLGTALKELLSSAHEKLPLEIVAGVNDNGKVLWRGKPAGDIEVVILGDGDGGAITLKTDSNGEFKPSEEEAKKLGMSQVLGVRAKYVEKKEGELDGKKYKEVRHYATLTIRLPRSQEAGQIAQKDVPKAEAAKEDPAASKLLADARAARAQYGQFPGFTADIVVNLDGKVSKGKVEVSKNGKVAVDVAEADAAKWATGQLAQTIGHRLDDSASLKTACAFVDSDEHHPLGRAIRVLDDEFHSSYRVRDRQIIVVNRTQGDIRFTITVVQNYTTEEGKFIPATFTVNTWDLKSDTLKSSQTNHHTWKRVGKFDLPETLTVVTATNGKLEAKSLTLSNLTLAK